MAKEPKALEHRELAVEALSLAEARELALALLGRDDAVALAQAHMVATESGGNPLFIDELVRHIQSGEPIDRWEAIGQLDLDEVLWARIQRQPEDAQRLLGLVAVSGRPIRQSLAFQASELGAGARVALASLRSARLIRCLGQAHNEEVEIYHDRIRETVVAHLSARVAFAGTTSGWRWCCRRPGRSTRRSSPFIIAAPAKRRGRVSTMPWRPTRPRRRWRSTTAARLYRIALELHQGTPAQAGVLWRKLGDALANAGRGSEAAQVYAKAAETADGGRDARAQAAGIDAASALRPRRRRAGAVCARCSARWGCRCPRRHGRRWLSLFWHRFLLKLRGLKFRKRDESQISAMDADADRSLLVGGGGALDVGADPRGRLPDAGAACWRFEPASRCGSRGPWRWKPDTGPPRAHRPRPRVASLLETAEQIAREIDSPYARGMIEMVRGFAALMRGEWKLARDRARRSRTALPPPLHGRDLGTRHDSQLHAAGAGADGGNPRTESTLVRLFPRVAGARRPAMRPPC